MNHHLQSQQSYMNTQNSSENSMLTSDSIYHMLLMDSANLSPINKFKVSKASKPLYPDTIKYPDFFNYNLVSPGRVIKILQGEQAVFRGFYYQLMKLAFQIQIQNKDYIEILKQIIFSPKLMMQQNASSPISGKNYSDIQYKKVIAEFIQILLNQNIPNFQLTIIQYPIVDEALVKIMENVLNIKYPNQASRLSNKQILQCLSQFFQVNLAQFGNCFKFQQSDIFLYQKSKKQLYIAFLNEMAEMSQNSSTKRSSSRQLSSNKKLNQRQHRDDQSDSEFPQKTYNIYQNSVKNLKMDQRQNSQLVQTPNRSQNRQYSSHAKNHTEEIYSSADIRNYRNTYGGRQANQYSDQNQYTQNGTESQVRQQLVNNRQIYDNLTSVQQEQMLKSQNKSSSYGSNSLINNLNNLMNTKSSKLQQKQTNLQRLNQDIQIQSLAQQNKRRQSQMSNLSQIAKQRYSYHETMNNDIPTQKMKIYVTDRSIPTNKYPNNSSSSNSSNKFNNIQINYQPKINAPEVKNNQIAQEKHNNYSYKSPFSTIQYNNPFLTHHQGQKKIDKKQQNKNNNERPVIQTKQQATNFNYNNYSFNNNGEKYSTGLQNVYSNQESVVGYSSIHSNLYAASNQYSNTITGNSKQIKKSQFQAKINKNVHVQNVPMINSITSNPYINSSYRNQQSSQNNTHSHTIITSAIKQTNQIDVNSYYQSNSYKINNSISNPFVQQVIEPKGQVKSNVQEKQEDLFHRPQKKTRFNLNQIQKPLKNQVAQDSLGTLYKQFTDTKVLNALPQIMQDNIRRMRKKYKGKHTKTFMGFY